MLSLLNKLKLLAAVAQRRNIPLTFLTAARCCELRSRTDAAPAPGGASALMLWSVLGLACQSSKEQAIEAAPRAALTCVSEHEKSVLLRKKWESFDAQSDSTPVPARQDGRVVAIRQQYDVRQKVAVDASDATVLVAPSALHHTSGDQDGIRFRAATQGDLTKFQLYQVGKQAWEEWSACIERTCSSSTTALRQAKRAYELYQSEATARELAAAETALEACRQ